MPLFLQFDDDFKAVKEAEAAIEAAKKGKDAAIRRLAEKLRGEIEACDDYHKLMAISSEVANQNLPELEKLLLGDSEAKSRELALASRGDKRGAQDEVHIPVTINGVTYDSYVSPTGVQRLSPMNITNSRLLEIFAEHGDLGYNYAVSEFVRGLIPLEDYMSTFSDRSVSSVVDSLESNIVFNGMDLDVAITNPLWAENGDDGTIAIKGGGETDSLSV